jgi:hypothetical protein
MKKILLIHPILKKFMEEYLEYGKQLLERYANGRDIEIKIIK